MLLSKMTKFRLVRIDAVILQLDYAFSQAAFNQAAGVATRKIESEPLLASYDADFNETNIYPERLL